MALEAVVYQQALFSNKDLYGILDNWSWDYNSPNQQQDHYFQDQEHQNGYQDESCQYNYNDHDQQSWEVSPPLVVPSFSNEWGASSADPTATSSSSSRQPKRRRPRSRKNEEEIENQRMTHIAVERNRRKQMNEYLSVLKSLMPDSYVQRGDQASIVGGAINFVKELEQSLHFLSAQRLQDCHSSMAPEGKGEENLPFEEFFSFPQYSTTTTVGAGGNPGEMSNVADVEVTMVESHANLKIRSRRRPKQLLNLVSGLQGLRLSVLHLNVSTVDQFALYSLSVRVEDTAELNSADEIATAVHQLLVRIQEGASSSN